MTTLRVEVSSNEDNADDIVGNIIRKILWYVCHDDNDDKIRFQIVPDTDIEKDGVWVRVLTSEQCKVIKIRPITSTYPNTDADQVLEIMKDASDSGNPTIHESAMLSKLGWVTTTGSPDTARLKQALKKLKKQGYIDRRA